MQRPANGMTIDTEDKLWVALYGGGRVIRINPENAEVEFEVELPVPKPTSCTFGGKDLNVHYHLQGTYESGRAEKISRIRISFQGKTSIQGIACK